MPFALAILLVIALNAPAIAQGPPALQRKSSQPARTATTETIPLPRPRPAPPKPDGMANLGVPSIGAGPEPQPPSPCFLALTAEIAVAEPLTPIAQPNSCDAIDLVKLSAVNIDKRRVTLTPPVTLRCPMATALARWMREDVAPAAAALGSPFAGFSNFDSFECRGRNRVAGARTSEHGRANAIDLRAVLLADGRKLDLTDRDVSKDFREAVKASACERFSTVLGPGSDAYHEDHIHLDLAERRGGYKMCQWNVYDNAIPLPRPRPAEAPAREENGD
jgi:hypothetical protein